MPPLHSHSQNIFQIFQNRETRNKTEDLENFLSKQLIENLKNENSTSQKVDFPNDDDKPLGYDPKSETLFFSNKSDSRLYVNNNATLKAWHIHSKKYDWVYEFDRSYCLTICKIAQEILIVSNSIIGNNEEVYSMIHLINIYTGKKIAEINDELKIVQNCVNAKQKKIFTYSSDLMTKEWNFDGSWLRIIKTSMQFPIQSNPKLQSYSEQTPSYFLSSHQFLVRIYKITIATNHLYPMGSHYYAIINNITNHQQNQIKIPHVIRSVFLHKKYLLLGWHNSRKKKPSDFGIIDVSSGNFMTKFKAFKNHLSTKSTTPNAVEAIYCHQDLAFLAHTTGEIMILNLANQALKILGKQNGYVSHLFFKDKILISTDIYRTYSKVKFWDIESGEEITEIPTFNLKKMLFSNGKLHLIQNSSLIIRDYLINNDNDSKITEHEVPF